MSTIYDKFDAATRTMSAAALLLDGKPVGRVVIKFGGAATAFVHIWGTTMATGRAGGGGYDKATAAVRSAVEKIEDDAGKDAAARAALAKLQEAFAGRESGERWTSALERIGFTICNVI